MITFYDVQQLLKSFDIIIYMKDRDHQLQLMEQEIRELYRLGLIDEKQYVRSIAILKKEMRLYFEEEFKN